eukprot:1712134-Rhodomonas_salina.2
MCTCARGVVTQGRRGAGGGSGAVPAVGRQGWQRRNPRLPPHFFLEFRSAKHGGVPGMFESLSENFRGVRRARRGGTVT